MLTRKKILIVISSLAVLLLVSSLASTAPKSGKILDSKTKTSPLPTQVYTPSVTPGIKSSTPPQESELYIVEKVVDGDTITVSKNGIRETVRLIGINTPESVDPRRPVECFGAEASNKAKALLSGRKVSLKEDDSQGIRDKYNRLLAYVYRDDGMFYNLWMIQNGYAYEYTYDTPYQYTQQFKNAQAQAQSQNKGLWADDTCSGKKPSSENNINNSSPPRSQGVGDKDCRDFLSQQLAQDFFIAEGGPGSDPHKLDSDGDGVVCESLP